MLIIMDGLYHQLEQWELAAKHNNDWNYPWGNEINENYANYNNTTTTAKVGYYNGFRFKSKFKCIWFV